MKNEWTLYGAALATTLSIAYIGCSIYDALFPPYGLLGLVAPASPFPISGSVVGFLTGLVASVVIGFVLGALYGFTWAFWSKRLK